jgi:hypothetical protein
VVSVDISAEPPIIKLVDSFTIGPVGGLMGQHKVSAPWWDGLDEVGGVFVNGQPCVHVDKEGVIIGTCSVSVHHGSPQIKPLDPLGGAIHPAADRDIEVNDAIIVLVTFWRVGESLCIVLNVLLQCLDGLLIFLSFLLMTFLSLEHGFSQPLGKCKESVVVNGGVCGHDGQHRVGGVRVDLRHWERRWCDGNGRQWGYERGASETRDLVERFRDGMVDMIRRQVIDR